jgi:hypothetical protein
MYIYCLPVYRALWATSIIWKHVMMNSNTLVYYYYLLLSASFGVWPPDSVYYHYIVANIGTYIWNIGLVTIIRVSNILHAYSSTILHSNVCTYYSYIKWFAYIVVIDISDVYLVIICDNKMELLIYYRHTMRVTPKYHQQASVSQPKHIAASIIYYMSCL